MTDDALPAPVDSPTRALRIAAMVKQIPAFEEMRLGANGRLERTGMALEMSAYDRRAVAKGVELAQRSGGRCTVFTLGPLTAEDCLRESIAFGADDGVLISDPAFAGSDTLATALALAAAVKHVEAQRNERFDLILVGRNSLDADTGQVGPEMAEILDLPFATGVKALGLSQEGPSEGVLATVGLELDDSGVDATIQLPAVLSTAERLIDPCKVKDAALRAAVAARLILHLNAASLGPGPWGQLASPTTVGEMSIETINRERRRIAGSVGSQVESAVDIVAERGALRGAYARDVSRGRVPSAVGGKTLIAVLVERSRDRLTRELLSVAALMARELSGRVVVIGEAGSVSGRPELSSWGADECISIAGEGLVEEDIAEFVSGWADNEGPWAILAGSTAWGREVASRVAARLGAGLTGDAVGLRIEGGRLVSLKPAFGGGMVAAVTSCSEVQLVTARVGMLGSLEPREIGPDLPETAINLVTRGRVKILNRRREDDVEDLLNAEVVVGIGGGVDPLNYHELDALVEVLDAQLGATRKVTDKGWMPHARQIGITGRSISPRLFISIGASGRYNHMVGVRGAGTVLAINDDRGAEVFAAADVGIVGDWREVVPVLVSQLRIAMKVYQP